ncbi:MAG: DNA-formamidopyrimidine glycosylase family protein [Acidimicrobiales bacterium]
MPEGVEIEMYRLHAERVVGETVASVHGPDDWFLKNGTTEAELVAVAVGTTVTAARRRGKLLLLDLSSGDTLGLRFGMTGRLIVGDEAAIAYLEYSSQRNDPAWDRFWMVFESGVELRIRDPRRLGGVELNPDEDRLGFDAFTITMGQLQDRVLVGKMPLKARLLDQQRIAGIGNLIADETLWRAGLDPARPADSLDRNEIRRLHRHLRRVLGDFMAAGGSHTGRLQQARVRGGHCPRDGTELLRREIGGRTTYSCPRHQV